MKAKDLILLLEKVPEDANINFKVTPETEEFDALDLEENIYLDVRGLSIEYSEDDGFKPFVSLT